MKHRKFCNNLESHFHTNLQWLDNYSFSFYCFNNCSRRLISVVWQHCWCTSICFSWELTSISLGVPALGLAQGMGSLWRKQKSCLKNYPYVLKGFGHRWEQSCHLCWSPRICSLLHLFVLPFKALIFVEQFIAAEPAVGSVTLPGDLLALEMVLAFQSELHFNLKSVEHSRLTG